MHDVNQRGAGHVFNKEIFEQQVFDAHLEKQIADSTSGMTPQDRKVVKLIKKIDKMNTELVDRRRIPQKTIDALAFKLRKLKLMMDKDYRKTLTFKQRLLLDQIHQSLLSNSLSNYVKEKGVEIIPYWDWSGFWRGTGTLWRNVITKWGFVELLIFPKFKGVTMSPGLAVYLAWYGLENDPRFSGLLNLKTPLANRITRSWHQLYVTGIISLISFISYAMYDATQMAKAEIIAANLAAAESIAQVPHQMKESWIKERHQSLMANFVIKRNRQPTAEEIQALREYAEYLYAKAEEIVAEQNTDEP